MAESRPAFGRLVIGTKSKNSFWVPECPWCHDGPYTFHFSKADMNRGTISKITNCCGSLVHLVINTANRRPARKAR